MKRTPEEKKRLKLNPVEEQELKKLKYGDELPEGYKWSSKGSMHDPYGVFVTSVGKIKGVDLDTLGEDMDLKKILSRYGGKNVGLVIKHFVDLAMGKGSVGGKVTPATQLQYCAKIIEFYHGRPGDNKNVNHNVSVSIDSKVAELTKMITAKNVGLENKVIDVTPIEKEVEKEIEEKKVIPIKPMRDRKKNPTPKEIERNNKNSKRLKEANKKRWDKHKEEKKKKSKLPGEDPFDDIKF